MVSAGRSSLHRQSRAASSHSRRSNATWVHKSPNCSLLDASTVRCISPTQAGSHDSTVIAASRLIRGAISATWRAAMTRITATGGTHEFAHGGPQATSTASPHVNEERHARSTARTRGGENATLRLRTTSWTTRWIDRQAYSRRERTESLVRLLSSVTKQCRGNTSLAATTRRFTSDAPSSSRARAATT